MGNLNIDLLDNIFSTKCTDLAAAYDLTNLVPDPTCFKSSDNLTLIDVMMTNRPKYIKTLDRTTDSTTDSPIWFLKFIGQSLLNLFLPTGPSRGLNHGKFVESLSTQPLPFPPHGHF